MPLTTARQTTGWINEGTWTPAANQAPTVVSVTPNPATGLTNTFALVYSDPNGALDLKYVNVNFNVGTGKSNTCYVSLYSGHQSPLSVQQCGHRTYFDHSWFRNAVQQSMHHHRQRHFGGEVGQ